MNTTCWQISWAAKQSAKRSFWVQLWSDYQKSGHSGRRKVAVKHLKELGVWWDGGEGRWSQDMCRGMSIEYSRPPTIGTERSSSFSSLCHKAMGSLHKFFGWDLNPLPLVLPACMRTLKTPKQRKNTSSRRNKAVDIPSALGIQPRWIVIVLAFRGENDPVVPRQSLQSE